MGGRHKSNTVDIIEYEKRNPKANKNVKVRKGNVIFVIVVNHKTLLSE